MIGAIFSATVLLLQAAPEAATPVSATGPAPTPTPTTAAHAVSPVTVTSGRKNATSDPAEMICHKEPVIGSLFPRKVCARTREMRSPNAGASIRRPHEPPRPSVPWRDPGG